MQTSFQLVPTGAPGVRAGALRPDDCPAFAMPNVHELPLRLECVAADSFGGLVGGRFGSCAREYTNRSKGALS